MYPWNTKMNAKFNSEEVKTGIPGWPGDVSVLTGSL